ncbi:MAG: hypothetical protein U1E56_06565 [Bauldia sp.]
MSKPSSAAAGWICLLLCALTVILLAPGRMGADELDMLQQATQGAYHDWHSPLIAWLWRVGLRFRDGSLGIDIAGIGLYFAGIYLLADMAILRGHPVVGWATLVVSVFPLTWIALATAGNKDVFLTGLMLVATGLLTRYGGGPLRRTAIAFAVLLALGLAFTVRHNAMFAAFPVLIALGTLVLMRFPPFIRAALAGSIGVAATVGLYFAADLTERATLGVRTSNVIASLYIFDLAGISKNAGVDAAGGLLGADFQAKLGACYDPALFDHYATWGECGDLWVDLFGPGYEGLMEKPADREVKRRLLFQWLSAIRDHPDAYLAHRLAHFRLASGMTGNPAWQMSPVDLEEFSRDGVETLSPVLRGLDAAATWLARAPYLAPYVWLAVGAVGLLALMFVGPSLAGLIAAMFFASGLVYGAAYFGIGVSYALRYFHWTIVAELLGLLWLAAAIVHPRPGDR